MKNHKMGINTKLRSIMRLRGRKRKNYDQKVYNVIAPYFNREFYSSVYSDIAERMKKDPTFDPVAHYLTHGASEGRDPDHRFSTKAYLAANANIKLSQETAFYHYIMNIVKRKELELKPVAQSQDIVGLIENLNKDDKDISGGKGHLYNIISREFNEHYYYEQYSDIAEAAENNKNFDPVQHFIETGHFEGRNPNPEFSTREYMMLNSDVRYSTINPFYHYLMHGRAEGRVPKQKIDRLFPALDASPRILFVSHSGNKAGAELMLLDIIAWYANHTCYKIDILVLEYGHLVQCYQKYGRVFSGHKDFYAADIESFPFKSETYDYIYCNTVASSRFHSLYRRWFQSKRTPVIQHIHEMKKVIHGHAAELTGLSPYVVEYIAASHAVAKDLHENFYVPKEKIQVANSFIVQHNLTIQQTHTARVEARCDLDIKQDAFVIVGAGTVYDRKGPDLFVKIIKELIDTLEKPVVAVWIGDGPDYHGICNWLSKDGLDKHIRFIGYREHARDLIAAADLFFLSSREDPYPLVCLEAATFAIPTVYFRNNSGIASFVRDDAGFILETEDVGQAARQLRLIAADMPRIAKAGAIARSRVSENNDIRDVMPRIFAHLAEILNVKPTLTVVIPNYNHEIYLNERIDSIINQQFCDAEILILDDASTDGSLNVVRKYERDPRVQVYVNEVGSGSAFKQWLKGANLARGSLTWIAESDDSCTSNFLSAVLPAFEDAAVVISYCSTITVSATGAENSADLIAYLSRAGGTKFHSSYKNRGTTEVIDTMGFCCTIVNASANVVRSADMRLALAAAQKYEICGDWLVYLHMLRQGAISYSIEAKNFFRRHPGSIISQKEGTDLYFIERANIAEFVIQNFSADIKLVNRIVSELMSEWERFRHIEKKITIEKIVKRIWELVDSSATTHSPKNLALYIHGMMFSRGGIERQGAAIANYFNRRGHNVTIYCRRCGDSTPVYSLDRDVRVEDIFDENAILKSVNVLRSSLARNRIDILIAMLSESLFDPVLSACEGLMIKTIASEHNDPWVIEQKWWSKEKRSSCFAKVDRIHLLLDKYAASVPVEMASKVRVIPNGVYMDQKKQPALPPRPVSNIIAIGRLEEQKNFSTLIKSFSKVVALFPAWSLTIVGEGSERKSLEALIKKYKLEDSVRLTGLVQDIDQILSQGSLIVIPSHFEGFPIVTIEAMLSGLPAVAYSSCNGPNEQIKDGSNGMLCHVPSYEDQDGRALAEVLIKLIGDDDLRQRLSTNARESCLKYSMDNVLPLWDRMIAELC